MYSKAEYHGLIEYYFIGQYPEVLAITHQWYQSIKLLKLL